MTINDEAEKPSAAQPSFNTNPNQIIGQTTADIALNKHGVILIPRPVIGDQFDPLNWSCIQKHTILAIIMAQ